LAEAPEIAALVERRRLLAAESGLLRAQMAQDAAQLVPTIAWAERGYTFVRALRSFWPVVATAAGFLVARKKGGLLGLVGKLWSVWRVAKNVTGFWKGTEKR
jgi:hypothetical protein